jgi:hypothetical protein
MPLTTSSVVTVGSLKPVVTLVHSHILSHNPLFSPYLLPYAWKRKRDIKRRRERKKGK